MALGTRLLSEHIIKTRYPNLKYVRIHTGARNTATIYAWNDNLQLPDQEVEELKKFANEYLVPYVCFQVKAYPLLKDENVPQVHEVPETIRKAAMSRRLDLNEIVNVINGLFTGGVMTYSRYNPIKGMIYFDVRSEAKITDIEKELIKQYLYEMIPLGSNYEVTYEETWPEL
jgi:hypothetical protein